MAINVSVQYSGGFLPDIILLTQGCYTFGEPISNAMEEVVYLFVAYETKILKT